MAEQDKSKKELSDKELAQATGGADIGGGGVGAESLNATAPTTGYVDEEGVYHEGPMPGTMTSAGGASSGGILNEEGELMTP
jgi:hypothetical protein